VSKRKEDVLERISYEDLLELAKSVSDKQVDTKAFRGELAKLLKDSLSIEEIERKAREIKEEKRAEGNKRQPDTTRVFFSSRTLKGSIFAVFLGFVLSQIAQWYYNIVANYINYNPLPLDSASMYAIRYTLNQVAPTLTLIANLVKLIGLALLTYWLFSSAIRASTMSHSMAAILTLSGALLVIGILISSMSLILYYPYYIL
jgi:hypothetical protein